MVGRVAARGTSLGGDEQANRKVHGGVDKAMYAYAREDYEWWEDELSTGLEPGTFRENLTTLGLDLNGALVGERWRGGPGPTSGSSRGASWAPAMRSRSCSGPSTE